MSHVIEHIDDPVGTLRRVQELLAPGGSVLIRYPNPQSLGAKVFKSFWYPWEVPRHLVIPAMGALTKAARTVGLKPMECETTAVGASHFFALSRSLKAGRTVDEYDPKITTRDVFARLLEHTLILFGLDVGEEIRITLRKADGSCRLHSRPN